jgi:hypothetical protein
MLEVEEKIKMLLSLEDDEDALHSVYEIHFFLKNKIVEKENMENSESNSLLVSGTDNEIEEDKIIDDKEKKILKEKKLDVNDVENFFDFIEKKRKNILVLIYSISVLEFIELLEYFDFLSYKFLFLTKFSSEFSNKAQNIFDSYIYILFNFLLSIFSEKIEGENEKNIAEYNRYIFCFYFYFIFCLKLRYWTLEIKNIT